MDDQDFSQRPVRVRFAPSPTGTLHVGSARTALYNYLFARHTGGTFVVRIEDTDEARSTRQYEESVLADLAWLGLDWDEGPDRGGGHGPYRQSERADSYREAAAGLLDAGHAYLCFCSQKRLDELKKRCLDQGIMPKYDRRCQDIPRDEAEERLAAGEPATIRFRVPDTRVVVPDIIHGEVAFDTAVIGDFIIMRSDGGVSYNFAVVVDDAAMEISHVIRGEDHLTNTARQLLLLETMGHEAPRYAHHSLILGGDGSKLSKRHGATSVGDFRGMGYLPGAIINYLALLSWSPAGDEEKLDKIEMAHDFDLAGVARSPAIFDMQKLNWLNGLYIRGLDAAELSSALAPYLVDLVPEATVPEAEPAPPGGQLAVSPGQLRVSPGQLAVAEAAVQTSLVTLADAAAQLVEFFASAPLGEAEGKDELRAPQAVAVMEMVLTRYAELPDTANADAASAAAAMEKARDLLGSLKKQCKKEEIPPKTLFRSLRIALTGRTSGPELPFLLAGLGRDTVRERLEAAIQP